MAFDSRVNSAVEFLASLLEPDTASTVLPKWMIEYFDNELLRDEIIHEAHRNKILQRSFRVLIKLEGESGGLQDSICRDIQDMLDKYALRSEGTLGVIADAQKALADAGVPFTVFKTVLDFPDLNSEIDILITKKNLDDAEIALKTVNPSFVGKGNWLGELPTKRHIYFLRENEEYEIELYPKFTEFGEDYIFDDEVINRSRVVKLGQTEAWCPTAEDDLLIACTHTLYRHGGIIKLSDIYSTVRTVSTNDIDWEYIYGRASLLGVSKGVSVFLSFIKSYYKERTGYDLPIHLKDPNSRSSRLATSKNLAFPYRFPTYDAIGLFTRKFLNDLRRFKFRSASGSFKTLGFKVISRAMYTALKIIGRKDLLRKLGWA